MLVQENASEDELVALTSTEYITQIIEFKVHMLLNLKELPQ